MILNPNEKNTIYSLVDYDTRDERRRLRKMLNENLSGDAVFYNGNDLYSARDLFGLDKNGKVGKFKLRRLQRQAFKNWITEKNKQAANQTLSKDDIQSVLPYEYQSAFDNYNES